MTEAMPFLQKAILLSYDPRPFGVGIFMCFQNAMDQLKVRGHRIITSHSCRSFNQYSSQVYLLNRPWNARSESGSEL